MAERISQYACVCVCLLGFFCLFVFLFHETISNCYPKAISKVVVINCNRLETVISDKKKKTVLTAETTRRASYFFFSASV